MKIKATLRFFLLGLMLALMTGSLVAQTPVANGDSGREATPAAQSPEAAKGEQDESEEYRHSAMVQKLGAMMGMSTEKAATTFEVVNFAILFVLVGGFLLKTLPKTFRDRTSTIQKHITDARTATEEASVRLSSVEDRLAQLDGQIATMRTQAEKDLAADELRVKASVEEEAKKILASADQEIAAATLAARRQLQQYAADLAIEQAAKRLVISAETDRLLVQGFVRRLAGDETKGGQN